MIDIQSVTSLSFFYPHNICTTNPLFLVPLFAQFIQVRSRDNPRRQRDNGHAEQSRKHTDYPSQVIRRINIAVSYRRQGRRGPIQRIEIGIEMGTPLARIEHDKRGNNDVEHGNHQHRQQHLAFVPQDAKQNLELLGVTKEFEHPYDLQQPRYAENLVPVRQQIDTGQNGQQVYDPHRRDRIEQERHPPMRVSPPQVGRHPMGDVVENKDDDGEEVEIVEDRILLPKEQRQQTKANANGHEYVVSVTEPAVPLALFYDLVYPVAKHIS